MRAKTVPHVEYEVLRLLREQVDLSALRDSMVPDDDEVAEKRFDSGAKSVLQLILNLETRRYHRLPKDHVDYRGKDE